MHDATYNTQSYALTFSSRPRSLSFLLNTLVIADAPCIPRLSLHTGLCKIASSPAHELRQLHDGEHDEHSLQQLQPVQEHGSELIQQCLECLATTLSLRIAC